MLFNRDNCLTDSLQVATPAQEARENVLFAAIPVGFREKYVPYPSNPSHASCGRLMVPFYPLGEGRENGIGLPMVHCLAQQGLKEPHDAVFPEDIALGKQFVSLALTVRRPLQTSLGLVGSRRFYPIPSGLDTTLCLTGL